MHKRVLYCKADLQSLSKDEPKDRYSKASTILERRWNSYVVSEDDQKVVTNLVDGKTETFFANSRPYYHDLIVFFHDWRWWLASGIQSVNIGQLTLSSLNYAILLRNVGEYVTQYSTWLASMFHHISLNVSRKTYISLSRQYTIWHINWSINLINLIAITAVYGRKG